MHRKENDLSEDSQAIYIRYICKTYELTGKFFSKRKSQGKNAYSRF